MNSINKFCPRSSKAVSKDALAEYKGVIVGFCNLGCRDDFLQNHPFSDCRYFDAIIQENEIVTSDTL